MAENATTTKRKFVYSATHDVRHGVSQPRPQGLVVPEPLLGSGRKMSWERGWGLQVIALSLDDVNNPSNSKTDSETQFRKLTQLGPMLSLVIHAIKNDCHHLVSKPQNYKCNYNSISSSVKLLLLNNVIDVVTFNLSINI